MNKYNNSYLYPISNTTTMLPNNGDTVQIEGQYNRITLTGSLNKLAIIGQSNSIFSRSDNNPDGVEIKINELRIKGDYNNVTGLSCCDTIKIEGHSNKVSVATCKKSDIKGINNYIVNSKDMHFLKLNPLLPQTHPIQRPVAPPLPRPLPSLFTMQCEDDVERPVEKVEQAPVEEVKMATPRVEEVKLSPAIHKERIRGKPLSFLQKRLIESFPTYKYIPAKPEVHSTCTICWGNYRKNTTLKTLPCSHTFHKRCLDKWLCRNLACPNCRLSLVPK